MERSKTSIFFNRFRNKSFNEFEIYVLLREISLDFKKILLVSLKKELNLYLEKEKTILNDSFSKIQIKEEVTKLESNDKPVPKIGTLAVSTNKKRKKLIQDKLEKPNIELLMFPNEFKSLYKLKDVIKERIESYQLKNQVDEIPNYTKIFSSFRAYEMFNYLIGGVDDRTQLVSISFIFRQMQKDNLILNHIKDTVFRNWLSKESKLKISIEQTKTLEQSKSNDRLFCYNTTKKLFKLD